MFTARALQSQTPTEPDTPRIISSDTPLNAFTRRPSNNSQPYANRLNPSVAVVRGDVWTQRRRGRNFSQMFGNKRIFFPKSRVYFVPHDEWLLN